MKNIQKSPYFTGASLSSTSRGSVSVEGKQYNSYSFFIDITYNPKAAEQSISRSESPAAADVVASTARGVER
jgi:hypothetical protein